MTARERDMASTSSRASLSTRSRDNFTMLPPSRISVNRIVRSRLRLRRFTAVVGRSLFRLFLVDEFHRRDHSIALVDVDQPHTLRVASHRTHAANRKADDHALFADDEHLVVVVDMSDPGDLAVLVRGLDV